MTAKRSPKHLKMQIQGQAKFFRKKHIIKGQQVGSAKGQFIQHWDTEGLHVLWTHRPVYLFYTSLAN